MAQTKDFACDWLDRNIDKTTAVDFHNFLRFLGHYYIAFKEPLSPSLRTLLTKWFMGQYESLAPDAFFEIFQSLTFLSITAQSQEPFFRLEDICTFVKRAVELADDADVVDILRLLSSLDHYSALYNSEVCKDFDSATSRLIEVLRTRSAPNDLFDLGRSIMWLAKSEWATIEYANSNNPPLHHPVGVNFDPAWKWLRSAVELAFDDADLCHRRGPAALAAVRAFQSKAVDFSATEINRLLQTAAAPFLADPSLPFKHQFYTSPHAAFIRLLVAIRTAANTDGLAEHLTVRFDDAFWRSFIEAHEANRRSNMGSNATAHKLIKDLSCVTSKLTPCEAAFLSAHSKNLDSNQRALIAQKYRRLNIFQRALLR
uniref:Uncharacterized protein n=1 Tax=Plectus sambesii TaxID=2011161 RepID=A0A914WRR2_9BILA